MDQNSILQSSLMHRAKEIAEDAENEGILWNGPSNQVVNIYVWLFSVLLIVGIMYLAPMVNEKFYYALLIPLSLISYSFFWLKSATYTITNQRMIRKIGLLRRTTFEIELFRVKDIHLYEPIVYRLFGVGNILLSSSQHIAHDFMLEAIPNAVDMREAIRYLAKIQRSRNNVANFDYDNQGY